MPKRHEHNRESDFDGKSEVLDSRAAAAYLGVSVSTLAKARCAGGGPSYIKTFRAVRYLRRDLEEWQEAHKRRSTSASSSPDSGRLS